MVTIRKEGIEVMKKHLIYLAFFVAILCSCLTANARISVCQNGLCDWTETIEPWMNKLAKSFAAPNLRVDFCQADEGTRSCIGEGISWDAYSPTSPIVFTIPVARALPGREALMFDYLILANESAPKCTFSSTSLSMTPNKEIRLASQSAQCVLSQGLTMQINETFLIDYLDFDASILGGHYSIQTSDSIHSATSGYALLNLRDGKTSRPILGKKYHSPDPQTMGNIYYTPDGRRFVNGRFEPYEEDDWWARLKSSLSENWQRIKKVFNMDLSEEEKALPANQRPTFFDKVSDTFMKVIYLEPLD